MCMTKTNNNLVSQSYRDERDENQKRILKVIRTKLCITKTYTNIDIKSTKFYMTKTYNNMNISHKRVRSTHNI